MVREIQAVVADHFGIDRAQMTSPDRHRCYARPRQIAMYLARTQTNKSLPHIAQLFGKRDHTTVIGAVRRIEGLCASDHSFCEEVQQLEREISTGSQAVFPIIGEA